MRVTQSEQAALSFTPRVPGVVTGSCYGMVQVVTHGGLGIITAGVFLAGEMAGSGVLALPFAMVGTGDYRIYIGCGNAPLNPECVQLHYRYALYLY